MCPNKDLATKNTVWRARYKSSRTLVLSDPTYRPLTPPMLRHSLVTYGRRSHRQVDGAPLSRRAPRLQPQVYRQSRFQSLGLFHLPPELLSEVCLA